MYDQSTRDASVLAADSFLSILLSKLDGCFDSVAILTGELQGRARAVGYLLSQALLPMHLARTRSLRGKVLSCHYWMVGGSQYLWTSQNSLLPATAGEVDKQEFSKPSFW